MSLWILAYLLIFQFGQIKRHSNPKLILIDVPLLNQIL